MHVDTTSITGYRNSHTVFRHTYEGATHHHEAMFAVRRVDTPDRLETQIEAKLASVRLPLFGGQQRLYAQHMSICMPPPAAVRFAVAIAPELLEVASLLVHSDRDLQAAIDKARTVLAMVES